MCLQKARAFSCAVGGVGCKTPDEMLQLAAGCAHQQIAHNMFTCTRVAVQLHCVAPASCDIPASSAKRFFLRVVTANFLQGRHIKQCRAALRHGPWYGPCRWRRCQMMRTRACFPAGTRAAAAAAVVPSWQAWLLVGLCQMTRVAKASSMRTRESQPDGMMSSGAMPTSACSQSSGTKVHMSAGSGQSMPPLALQDAPGLKG